MARKLGITQDGGSRLEKRSDLLLSTLRKTVKAMGGNLSLIASFPTSPRVLFVAEYFTGHNKFDQIAKPGSFAL